MPHLATTSRLRALEKSLAWLWIATLVAISAGATPGRLIAEEAAPKLGPPVAAHNDDEKTQPAQHAPAQVGRPSGRIQYVGPDTYILLDSEGRPQPVPGMTYEDFLAAWRKLNQAASPGSQPRFTIESIKIEGQTHDQRAELKFDTVIHLLVDGPVDVPLGLVGAFLQGEPRFGKAEPNNQSAANEREQSKFKGDDEYLSYDPEHGGFVARIIGHAGERKSLSIDIIVALSRDGSETTLSLNCPRSVSSSLSLDVDSSIVDARASGGAVLSQKSIPNGRTRIGIAGPAGQFRLTWQRANTDEASIASVLNAVGAIHVAIDGRGVRNDARLTVRSFGGAFDHFRVRLPQGAKFIPAPIAADNQDPKFRVSVEAPTTGSSAAADNARQVVVVELKEKQQGPVVVDLSTEQSSGSGNAGQPLELAGFEVIGAVRQFGDLALSVASDWQARWDAGQYVRQVDSTELDTSLQRSDLTAAFQYDRQPWSLGVRVAPRQSRVHVTPQYELELLPEEARLTVRLAYQVFGARAFEFRVETDGWELSGEPVESGGLVDQDRIAVTPEGILLLPLAQASSRKAEVSFSLRRALSRDMSRLELPLPAPLADSVGTGELTVRVAPEIELLPDLVNSTGIAAAAAPEATERAPGNTGAELHFRSLLPSAVLVANRVNRSREQSAQVANKIDIASDAVQVDQRIEYVVRYEPIKELVLEASSKFPIGDEGVEIALLSPAGANSELADQRTPLHFEPIVDENESSVTRTRRVRTSLPQPQVGKFTVGVRYRIPRPQALAADGTQNVPLLSPIDSQVSADQATVISTPGISVSLNAKVDNSSWKTADSPAKNDITAAGHEFVAERAELTLPLIVGTTEPKAQATTIVDRVWLQAWLSNDIEQDRAAFRFRTSGTQTTVEMPPNAPPGEVEVLVDGRPAEVSSRATGRVVVRLDSKSLNSGEEPREPAAHTLELRFRRPVQQSLIARHLITPPQIDGTTELAQVYWQIILPGDEHIIHSPNQLPSASQWQWLGSFWGCRPVMSQPDLEKWVGASSQLAPAAAENQYLFTGLLPVSSIALITAPRWLIVLIVSSAALALLAGSYYLPRAQRTWLWVAMIFMIAAAAIAYPTAALLIAQASAIGVVLASLSVLISRLTARPGRRRAATFAAASSQRMITPRGESIVMPSVIAAASTAPTVTLRSSDSER